MGDKLLVRLYNVGLGDCIYVRVPDGDDEKRHILIDCGNKFGSTESLREAIQHLETELPDVDGDSGMKRLDLLVVTHPHEDHVRGFDPDLFRNIHIERLWLSAGMNPKHPDNEENQALQAFAASALDSLRGRSLSPAVAELVDSLYELTKGQAIKALKEGTLGANTIEPVYVHAGTPEDPDLFKSPEIRLQVLAPEADIDHVYVGKMHEALSGFQALTEWMAEDVPTGGKTGDDGKAAAEEQWPSNVSRADFLKIRQRLSFNALSFVLAQGHLVNNLSVVLLLEWHGRRLLFPGDAEVKTAFCGDVKEGHSNGSWNVMWERHRDALEQPLDFLKVGHHGSENATPWTAKRVRRRGGEEDEEHPINQILEALLPRSRAAGAPTPLAVVSTFRTDRWDSIPDSALMEELGRRVANAHKYEELEEKGQFVRPDVFQPQRTDLDHRRVDDDGAPPATGKPVHSIDVELTPSLLDEDRAALPVG